MSPSQPPNTPSFARSQIVMTAFTVALLLAGWSIFVWFGVKPFLVTAPPTPPVPPKPSPTIEPQPTPVAPAVPMGTYADAEQKLLLDLQRLDFSSRMKPLQTRWHEIQTRHVAWTQRTQSLHTSEEGRRLATTTLARHVKFLELTVAGLALGEVERQLSDLQRTLGTLESPIPKPAEWDLRFSALDTQLAVADATIQQCDSAVTQLLSTATQPQSQTLQHAIDTLSDTDQRAVRDAVKRRVDTLQKNHETELRSARQRHQELKDELVKSSAIRKTVVAETRLAIDAAQANSDRNLQALSEKKTEARKAMETGYPAVRTLLTAFTGSGYKQLDASSTFVTTTESKPLSYTSLLRSGALDEGVKGLTMLFQVGQCKVPYQNSNDRDRGGFPELRSEFDIQKPTTLATLKHAQAFLRTHGEAMVEAKLLSP